MQLADPPISRSTAALVGVATVLVVAYATIGWVPGPRYPSPVPYETEHGDLNLSGVAGGEPVSISGRFVVNSDGGQWRVIRLVTIDPHSARAVGRHVFHDDEGRTDVTHYAVGNRTFSVQRASTRADFQRVLSGVDSAVRVDSATRTVYEAGYADPPDLQVDGGLVVGALGNFAWKRVGTTTYEGREVIRYVPETGWTYAAVGDRGDGRRRYVKAASGELLVDRATGVPLYANATGTFETASNWGQVILGSDFTVQVSFAVDLDVAPPREPLWVDDVRRAANRTA